MEIKGDKRKMIKRICDCCGEELEKDFVSFYIEWNKQDGTDEKAGHTRDIDCCEKCFNDLLEKLGTEKEIKEE